MYIYTLTDALEKVAVVVEALLTVALVAWLRVLTATLLADFFSKQRTLVDICRGGKRNLFLETDCHSPRFTNLMRSVLKSGGAIIVLMLYLFLF